LFEILALRVHPPPHPEEPPQGGVSKDEEDGPQDEDFNRAQEGMANW
jgi:hypothetical protein